MNIVTTLEEINLKLRNDEAQANSQGKTPKTLVNKGELYRNRTKSSALERFVNDNRFSKEQCSITDIASLAKFIVTNQIFIDGNHRTGMLACYLLSLELRSELLKIKPLYLYAAIDFEYLKSESSPGEIADYALFQGNAIELAIRSRSIKQIYSEDLKAQHYANVYDIVSNLGATMRKLRDDKHPSPGQTTQKRLFRVFAGHREGFCHSTSSSIESQIQFAKEEGVLYKPYSPPIFHSSDASNRLKANSISSESFSSMDDSSCLLKSIVLDENDSNEPSEISLLVSSSRFLTISPSRNGFFYAKDALINKGSPCSVGAMISPITTEATPLSIGPFMSSEC